MPFNELLQIEKGRLRAVRTTADPRRGVEDRLADGSPEEGPAERPHVRPLPLVDPLEVRSGGGDLRVEIVEEVEDQRLDRPRLHGTPPLQLSLMAEDEVAEVDGELARKPGDRRYPLP